jgi:hypothetical protein
MQSMVDRDIAEQGDASKVAIPTLSRHGYLLMIFAVEQEYLFEKPHLIARVIIMIHKL